MGDGTHGPNVSLTFSHDFSLSKFTVTNDQFGAFIADGGYAERKYWTANGWKWKVKTAQPAFRKDAKLDGQDQPVVGVSWYEAVAFRNYTTKPGSRLNVIGFRVARR